MKRLRTLNSSQIFKIKIKKSKTYSGLCPFKGPSNDTTLRLIQSGRMVPLNGHSCRWYINPVLGVNELKAHGLYSSDCSNVGMSAAGEYAPSTAQPRYDTQLHISTMETLKIVGNEKQGCSGRGQMLGNSLGPWQSRIICHYNMQFQFKNLISVSACNCKINRRIK